MYMEVDDANKIANEIWGSMSREMDYWRSCSKEDQEVFLKVYSKKFDSIHWIGYKKPGSNSSWPRIIDGSEVNVPYEVKVAMLEQIVRDKMRIETEYWLLRQGGVKRYAIEGASIEFNSDGIRKIYGVDEDIFYIYLSRWVY